MRSVVGWKIAYSKEADLGNADVKLFNLNNNKYRMKRSTIRCFPHSLLFGLGVTRIRGSIYTTFNPFVSGRIPMHNLSIR